VERQDERPEVVMGMCSNSRVEVDFGDEDQSVEHSSQENAEEADRTELEKVCCLRCMEDCDTTMPLERRTTGLEEDLIDEEERPIEPEAVGLREIETAAEVRRDERIIDDLIDKVGVGNRLCWIDELETERLLELAKAIDEGI